MAWIRGVPTGKQDSPASRSSSWCARYTGSVTSLVDCHSYQFCHRAASFVCMPHPCCTIVGRLVSFTGRTSAGNSPNVRCESSSCSACNTRARASGIVALRNCEGCSTGEGLIEVRFKRWLTIWLLAACCLWFIASLCYFETWQLA